MDIEIQKEMERLKVKAELFLENDIRAFIVDHSGTYFFCDILLVGEIYLVVKSFEGKRKGETDRILWVDIKELKEYEGVGG